MKVVKMLIDTMAVICYAIIAGIVILVAPMVTGNRPMIVLSGSMMPTYEVGSLVYMKETPFNELKVGDVITYGSSEDSLVTHRIVEISQLSQTVITKGDANNVNDPEITADKVKGKINEKVYVPYAGYALQTIRKPVVMIALAVILIVKMAADNLLVKPKKGSKTKKHQSKSK